MKFVKDGKIFDTDHSELLDSTEPNLGWLEGPVCFEQTQFFRSPAGVCFAVDHQFKCKGFFNIRPSKDHYAPSTLRRVYDSEAQCAEAMSRDGIPTESFEGRFELDVA